jgi:hypothetical protein
MSLKWAQIVAAHLISNVKQFVEGCGGETHLIHVPHSGSANIVTDQREIADSERYLGPISHAINAVLPDGTTNDETVIARLRMVTSGIDKALRSHVIEPKTGGMILQSGSTTVSYYPGQTPLTLRVVPTQPPTDPEAK